MVNCKIPGYRHQRYGIMANLNRLIGHGHSFLVGLTAYLTELVEIFNGFLNIFILKINAAQIVVQGRGHILSFGKGIFEIWNCLYLNICFGRLLVTNRNFIMNEGIFFSGIDSFQEFRKCQVVTSNTKKALSISQWLTSLCKRRSDCQQDNKWQCISPFHHCS